MAKGRILISEDKCKGCNLCVHQCPVNILALDTSKTNKKGYTPVKVTDEDKCIACTFCAMICPDNVITVERYIQD